MIQNRIFTFIITLFVFCFTFNTSVFANSNTAIEIINQERIRQNLGKLKIDPNLCLVAQKLADDSELLYPKKININDTKYSSYLKNYSSTTTTKLTSNDFFVEAVKSAGEKVSPFSDEDIAQATIQNMQDDKLLKNINYGCTATSSGKVGYKPFAYFVGGKQKPINEIFFSKIFSFFSTIFNKTP